MVQDVDAAQVTAGDNGRVCACFDEGKVLLAFAAGVVGAGCPSVDCCSFGAVI